MKRNARIVHDVLPRQAIEPFSRERGHRIEESSRNSQREVQAEPLE
jgi:hypothetical protein